MDCTPYPTTTPCAYAPPLHIDPYGPGLPVPSRFEDELYLLSMPVTMEAQAVPVPEPAAALLLSLGVLALCARWRFRC